MSKRRLFLVLLGIAVCLYVLDIFFFRPSGVYSYTKGEAYGFTIGINKEEAFNRLSSKDKAILSFRTREPFHSQNLYRDGSFELTEEAEISNYWVLNESANYSYLLIFRDDKLYRVLGHLRRSGEIETGLSMFTANYPKNTSQVIIEDKDTFAGLSQEQIDELVLHQREWTKVFLN
jgi:hypothetical protein